MTMFTESEKEKYISQLKRELEEEKKKTIKKAGVVKTPSKKKLKTLSLKRQFTYNPQAEMTQSQIIMENMFNRKKQFWGNVEGPEINETLTSGTKALTDNDYSRKTASFFGNKYRFNIF